MGARPWASTSPALGLRARTISTFIHNMPTLIHNYPQYNRHGCPALGLNEPDPWPGPRPQRARKKLRREFTPQLFPSFLCIEIPRLEFQPRKNTESESLLL